MRKGQGFRLVVGLIAVFALFQFLGKALGSDRGQAGILIGAIIVVATIGIERVFFGGTWFKAFFAVGLGRPVARGILAAVGISAVLLASVLLFAVVTGTSFTFYPGTMWLLPGLFFQAGIAEETLFRGYLFGHLEQRHTFWKATGWAAIPFVLVHLILFYSLPWSIGIASILLSVAMSFPFSSLYELGGRTIWAPAILHFVTQAGVKILVPKGEAEGLFAFYWIAACAVVPLAVYALPGAVRIRERRAT